MEHFEKYLGLVYRYLGVRARSEKEVRDYLKKKNAESDVEEKIISMLYEQKFLDDMAFAQSWIRSRARARPKGRKVLIMELRQKGVSDEIITQALAEPEDDLPDELTQAKQLIVRRVERLQGEPRLVIYQKVGAFLARRGFDWDTTRKAIDSVLQENKQDA